MSSRLLLIDPKHVHNLLQRYFVEVSVLDAPNGGPIGLDELSLTMIARKGMS